MNTLINNVAVYVRTTTTDEGDAVGQLNTIDNYLSKIKNEYNGIIVTVFSDLGYSGTSLDRPALNALREKCQHGEINLLVVSDYSRLSCSPGVTMELYREFNTYGVVVESCANPTLVPDEVNENTLEKNNEVTQVDNELVAKIYDAFAAAEKEVLSKKIKAGLQRRKLEK